MQKLLQLPVSAVNLVKTVQSQAQGQGPEEAKSPVLTPDSGQQTWYSAVQPDELRHLRPGGETEERAPLEEGVVSIQAQPLR